MKLANTCTLLLVLNLSAVSVASDQHLRVRQLRADTTAAPAAWVCQETLVPIGTWDDDYWWRELPSCVQDAAAVFGYNEERWDDGEEICPKFCDEWWIDLTDEQKEAAWAFGYDEENWNSSR
eukprot:CAMPEP_0201721412 /NCGR_PEP_ID=MMETSP0593-20130828/6091_1 /ASSEMBLY_ACC=CAM_ASM_000672 /TAXON_ID=267983 /ORGANISM="Skeletonema japonicum, Strain CCMP2506" /LENGTH=121 /DNA_ID=CAMNT_0048212229 /DNA_START=41 /DNA_END=406 /DNA_ORIENTATION=+